MTLDTSNPPFPGEPASTTNLDPANQQALLNFFGTSSATPNAAAVAALMLEEVPQLTPAEIRQGLDRVGHSDERPRRRVRGTPRPATAWSTPSTRSMPSTCLRVASTNPSNGETVTVTPSAITVTFNKPVNFSTVEAGDLTFLTEPTGVTVNVGTPIAVDNPTDPTIIQFPFSFTKPAGTLANGAYTLLDPEPAEPRPSSPRTARTWSPSGTIAFTLADVTAPVVTGDHDQRPNGPDQFSKALDPATVTLQNIFVIRQGSAAIWPPSDATIRATSTSITTRGRRSATRSGPTRARASRPTR